ncbi:MAG: hypothetical protein PHE51_04815 [Eubacteriales bacterium]|nr:hypothetical protein [Eubacteriales bacterium]
MEKSVEREKLKKQMRTINIIYLTLITLLFSIILFYVRSDVDYLKSEVNRLNKKIIVIIDALNVED